MPISGSYVDLNPSSAPAGAEGRFYYDSTNKKLYYHDGTGWKTLQVITEASAIVYIEGDLVVAEDRSGDKIAYGVAGEDDAKVIQKALDVGGKIVLANMFNINQTLVVSNNVVIEGLGYETGIRGNANPLIQTSTDTTQKLILKDMKIETTTENDGVKIEKTWTPHPYFTFNIERVWFHASGSAGTLLDIYGARLSTISNCWFSSATEFGGSAVGINFRGDDDGGAMGIHVVGCKFLDLYTALKSYSTNRTYLAGIFVSSCKIIGCVEPINFTMINNTSIQDVEIDNNRKGVIIDSCQPFRILNCWISPNGNGNPAIEVYSTYANTYYFDISHNRIISIARTKGDGIKIEAKSGGHIQYGNIESNKIQNVDTAINLISDTETPKYVQNLHVIGNTVVTANTGVHLNSAHHCRIFFQSPFSGASLSYRKRSTPP